MLAMLQIYKNFEIALKDESHYLFFFFGLYSNEEYERPAVATITHNFII